MVSSTGDEFTSVSLAPSFRAFAEYSGTLARASSIAHWQLRDLVCCVANPNASAPSSASFSTSSSSRRSDDAYDPQLFVVRHCSTLRYSLRDRKSTVTQALPFAPTSMTAGHGYVAAGGQHGQLDVRRLCDGAVVLRGAAGGSVNNALALAPTNADGDGSGGGGVTLFVCNNDCSIKAYALPPVPSSFSPAGGRGAAPRSGSGNGRRRRGVRGGGGGGGGGRRRSGGGGGDDDGENENDENEMMALDGGNNEHDAYDFDNECDDFSEGELGGYGDGEDGGSAAAAAAAAEAAEAAAEAAAAEAAAEAAADTVAAAFEDHHFDSLEQQRQEQRRRRQQQEQQQQRVNSTNSRNVEAGRETLMASLEARVAAAVAAAVGAAAAATSRNNNDGVGEDTVLRPRSASDGNVAAAAAAAAGGSGGGGRGGNSSSAALLRRRANAAAAATANATTASASAAAASARAARLAASSPAAVVRCLDPVNYCAPSPPHARGVPGFSSSGNSGAATSTSSRSGGLLVSPATLAAVGDCPSLSLHCPAESGYVPLASWDLFDDAGMACAWGGASGSFVAAVAQCGTVACVDPRVGRRAVMRSDVISSSSSYSSSSSSSSSSVVARWRTPGGGAARALKASPPGAATDLLLVTEHDSFAHLVDARRFDAAQTLEIGLPGSSAGGEGNGNGAGEDEQGRGGGSHGGGGLFFFGGGGTASGFGGGNGNGNGSLNLNLSSSGPTANGGHHLSGAAFSPEGDLAFIGAEDGGVAVFDVRTAERCCVGESGYR